MLAGSHDGRFFNRDRQSQTFCWYLKIIKSKVAITGFRNCETLFGLSPFLLLIYCVLLHNCMFGKTIFLLFMLSQKPHPVNDKTRTCQDTYSVCNFPLHGSAD